MEFIQIAIDGPAGAGKSTIAKKISKELNITYIDTGAMYRALTYKVLSKNIDVHDEEKIINTAYESDIQFIKDTIYLDNSIVNNEIRSMEVTNNVSYIAKIQEVRTILVALQQKIASGQDVIMDGRDIGTHVLPTASLKIFLTASVEERAYRRYLELQSKDVDIDLEELKKDILRRDQIDSEREAAPLIQAEDAILLDTTGLSIDDVVKKIIDLLKGR